MRTLWLFFLCFLITSPAQAHRLDVSYIDIALSGHQFRGEWDMGLLDLQLSLGLDKNGDGAISWGELRTRRAEAVAQALPALMIHTISGECTAKLGELRAKRREDGHSYASFAFSGICPDDLAKAPFLDVEYRLFFNVDSTHKALLHVSQGENRYQQFFTTDIRRRTIDLQLGDARQQFLYFAGAGLQMMLFNPAAILTITLGLAIFWRRKGYFIHPAGLARLSGKFWPMTGAMLPFALGALGFFTLQVNMNRLPISFDLATASLLALICAALPIARSASMRLAPVFFALAGIIFSLGWPERFHLLRLPKELLWQAELAFALGILAGMIAAATLLTLLLAYWPWPRKAHG